MSDTYDIGPRVAAPAPTEGNADYDIGADAYKNPYDKPPASFQDRIAHGNRLYEALSSIGGDVKEGFGQEQLGFSPGLEADLRRMGVWHDPSSGFASPIRMMSEAVMKPAAAAVDAVFRGISAGVHGLGGVVEQLALTDGLMVKAGSQGDAQRMKEETINFLNWSMMRGDANFSRPRGDANFSRAERPSNIEAPVDKGIGALPKPEEFRAAADVISEGQPTAALQDNLYRLWHERGVHPAEVAQDIHENPVLKQELMNDSTHLPEPYAQLTLPDGTPNPNVAGDIAMLRPSEVSAAHVQKMQPGEVVTRILPDGRVVPAPEEVVGYLKDFAKEAGFTITLGPEMTTPSDKIFAPMYLRNFSKDANTGSTTVQRTVYMPDDGASLYRRWFGLDAPDILYHEVGHALDDTVLRRSPDTSGQRGGLISNLDHPLSPEVRAEAEMASRAFKPKLWEMQPKYNGTPAELMADAVAQWLRNPEMRTKMPEFTKAYGAQLAPYLAMAEKYLPTRTEAGWVAAPGKGGAGEGGGGGRGGGLGGGLGGPEHEPRRIEGPRMTPEEAQQSILGHISVDKNADTSKNFSWSRFYTNMVDKFHPIAEAVKDARGRDSLAAGDDPYKLARMFAGWAGKATRMLEHGTIDFNTYRTLGPSLKAILKDHASDLNPLRAFVAAARAKELELRGIETGFDPRAINALVTREAIAQFAPAMEKLVNYQNQVAGYLRESGVVSRKAYDAMLEANRLFVPFHVAIDHANIGIEQIGKALQPHNPIKPIKGSLAPKIDPIESIVKNTYIMTAMAEKNVVATKMIDLLLGDTNPAGSDLRLPPPRTEATGRAVTKYLGDEGLPAGHAGDLGSALEDMGRPDKKGEISRYVNGVRETYKVDSDLARAMTGLNSETVGMLEKLMKPLTSTLRAGAVLTPDFMVRHTFRDFIYAFVTTSKGIFHPIDMARGFGGILAEAPAFEKVRNLVEGTTGWIIKDKAYWDWQAGGGGGTSMVHLDRNYLQDDLHRLTGQTGLMTRAWNVVIDPTSSFVDKSGAVLGLPFKAVGKYVLHPLQLGTELVTSASHLAAYKKSARYLEATSTDNKANILEAAWVSRHTAVDAARIGANMKAYNMISAFANIKIQDTDRIVRAFGENPLGTSLKIAVGITAPSLVLWAVNKDETWYKETPLWEKDVFWHIHTHKWEDTDQATAQTRMAAAPDQVRTVDGKYQVENGATWRLPKPFAAGVIFGSGPERLAEAFYHKNPKAFDHFLGSIMETTVGEVLPNAIVPMVDQAQNRVSFTGRTLVPAHLEKQLPEYQYTEYTTELTKAVGKMFSAFPGMEARADRSSTMAGGAERALTSPIQIENYVRAWSGGLGMYALNAADLALRKAGILPDPVRATSTLADIPVVRAFVSRYPSANTQSIQAFYDTYDKNKTFYDTWMEKAKSGDSEATERISRLGGPKMFLQLEGIKTALNAQSQFIHAINKNPEVKPAEKRQLLDSAYYGMISIGQAGMASMKEIDKALGNKTSPGVDVGAHSDWKANAN